MPATRRQLLHALGAASTVGLVELPGSDSDTDRVFVHPSDGVGELLDPIVDVGGERIREYDNFSFVVAEIPSDRRDSLVVDQRVAFIEDDSDVGIPSGWLPDVLDLLDPSGEPDCEEHPRQEPSWGWERIGADEATVDGSDVKVGVLDTGIATDHCSLEVAGGRDFSSTPPGDDYEDRHGHGTHVAGVLGATDNDIGVVGVAPAADLYAVKVLDDSGSGSYSSLIAGIDWCMSEEIPVISMSLGGDAESDSVDQAIEAADDAGHLLVCAAGNDGNRGDGACAEETVLYPATHEAVLAVVAMDPDDGLADYSSVGSAVDFLAPGTDIISTYIDNTYATANGTSVACPFVTGVAALHWHARDETEPGQNAAITERLYGAAEPILGTCEEGYGLVKVSDVDQPDDSRGDDTPIGDDNESSHGDRPGSDDFRALTEDTPWWTVPSALAGVAAIGYAVRRRLRGRGEE